MQEFERPNQIARVTCTINRKNILVIINLSNNETILLYLIAFLAVTVVDSSVAKGRGCETTSLEWPTFRFETFGELV